MKGETHMSEVIVAVVLQAKPGSGARLRKLMVQSAQETHCEPGCLTFALNVANNDPDRMALIERWADQQALDAHMEQPYVRQLFADLADVLAAPPVTAFCSALPAGDPAKGTLPGLAR
jgi:quinol monooxygenase YgiN